MEHDNQFGVNVWWTVPRVVVDGKLAQSILIKHGFEEGDMRLPSKRKEFSRGCRSLNNRRTLKNRVIAEITANNPEHVVYGLLEKQRKDREHVAFDQKTTVRFKKEDGSVTADGVLEGDVIAAVDSYKGKITDEDIRAFLVKVIKICYGVSKRPNGGIYFVPARCVKFIKSAQKVLEDLETGAKVYIEGVSNGAQEREYVWESVEENIESEIQESLLAVDRISRSVSAIANQQARIEKLSEIMDVYRGLLGQEAKYEGIKEKIEKAVGEVSSKMLELKKVAENKATKSVACVKRVTVYNAILDVLKNASGPMHYGDITKSMIASGTYSGKSKNPNFYIYCAIRNKIKNGDSQVVTVKRGVYDLSSRSVEQQNG